MSVSFHVIRDGALVSDPDAVPELFKFPGGEWHLRNVQPLAGAITWVAMVRGADPNDLVAAALLGDVAYHQSARFVLLLPYLPAARADRGIPLGAGVYADFIRSMNVDMVVTVDAHSDVMPGMLDFCTNLGPADLVAQALDRSGYRYDALIAPDKGAAGRVEAVAARLGLDFYQAEKTRDFDTGRILDLKIPQLPQSGRYLVVDDICDGGGTFKLLAGVVDLPAEQLGLWVTHGIFSGVSVNLREYYGEIFTTDSHPGHGRVGVATHVEPLWPCMIRYASDYATR